MHSFERLSIITGFELDKFREIFRGGAPIMPDKEVLPGHLARLCEIAHKPAKPSTYILVSEKNCFYRGVVLEDVIEKFWDNRWVNWHVMRSLTVVYTKDEGERITIKMSYGFSGSFQCINNQSIKAYLIDFSESLFMIQEKPLIEEFDEIDQYEAVSIGHNSKGFFFMDQNNNRTSVYFESIHRDPSGCFMIEKDSFWGIANNLGKVVLNPLYCAINPFSEGLAAILGYKVWGFVDHEGKVVIVPQYETVEAFDHGVSKVSVSGDRFGLINKEGNGVITKDSYIEFPEYSLITQEGDSFYGLLRGNMNNERVWKRFTIPALNAESLRKQKTCDYLFIGDCLVAKRDGHKYLYSRSGDSSNEIEDCQILDYCHRFNNKSQKFDGPIVRHIEITDLPFYYLVSRGNNKGVINNSGDIIVPIEYEYIGLLSSQVILAYNSAGMRLFSTNPKKSGDSYTQSYELIEKKEESYDSKAELNQFYVFKTSKVGFIVFEDGVFKTLFPCVYDYIDYHYYSTYNNENRHVGSFIIDGLSTNRKILGSDGVLIDKPKDISWMTDFSFSGIAVALKDDLFGLIDSNQNTLRDYSYDTIFRLDAFHFLLSKNNHIELVRFNRELEESVITEIPGLVVSRLFALVFRVLRSGKYYVYKFNEQNEVFSELIERGHDQVFGIDESFIVVEERGLWGCYDDNGHKILDIKYESIVPVKNPSSHYPKNSAIQLTVNKIVIANYPKDSNGDFLCDLYNIESRKLLHVYKSWFTKDNSWGGSDIVCPGNWFDVKYVDEYKPHLGAYLSLSNCSKQIYITSVDCQRIEGPFDKIEPCYGSGNLGYRYFQGLSTYQDGKRGLIRLNPFDVIPCEFDHPVYFVDGSNRFWILEKSNEQEPKITVYDSIKRREVGLGNVSSVYPVSESVYKVSVLSEDEGPKCVLVDNSFKQIVPLTYDSISHGNKGQFIVQKRDWGCYGIIDETGKYIYPLSHGRISYQWDGHGYSYHFYDENDVLSAVSEDGYFINDVVDGIDKEFISNSKNHYISEKEESGVFSVCTSFGEKYTGIKETYTEDDVTILKTEGGFFAINAEKKITPTLHEIITFNKRQRYLSVKDGRHRQFVDYNGESLGEIEGDYAGCILYKEAGVMTTIRKKDNGQLYYGLISIDGRTLSDVEFSFIGSFNENYATCVVNSDNPIDKEFFNGTKKEHFFAFNQKNYGQWGIINNLGEIIIPMRFDFIRPVKNGMTIYVKDRKYGIINLIDHYRTAPIFKFLFSFSEGLCAFRSFENAEDGDGIWEYRYSDCGLINEKGQIVVSAAYYRIHPFKEGMAIVESSSHFINQIDYNGNLLREWKKLPSREEPYEDHDEGYTQDDLEHMYRAAFEGDPSAQWNID